MSVDTYLKGKDTSSYRRVAHDDVEVLVAPSLARFPNTVTMAAKGPRFWRRLDVAVAHEHGPT